jgi:Tol biopolymer transport system component
MEALPLSADSIRKQLGNVLSSATFGGATRSSALLAFIVGETLNGRADRLKEYTIGAEALGRGESFDPRTDPIVRAEASRLRTRLERYYAAEGQADPVAIVLPKGSYVPRFVAREARAVRESTGKSHGPPELGRSRKVTWLAVGALAGACAFAIGTLVLRRPTHSPEPRLVQFDAELRSRGTLGGEVGTSVILSPDSTRIVFISTGMDGVPRLNTRRLDQSQVAELTGTEGARGPFFSPDGGWVGFFASGKLKKTPIDGGLPVVLCDAPDLLGASWGEDGQIIASLGGRTLSRVSAAGGRPSVVLDLTRESASPVWPQVLPGAKAVLFTAVHFPGPNQATIEVLFPATGQRRVLARDGTFGRYVPDSFLTYVNQGTLFAVPIDLDRLEARGTATPVLEGVSYSSTFGFAELDFSRTGVLLYRKNNGGLVTAQWLDSTGRTEPLLAKPGSYLWPRLSPDGKRLAISSTESGETAVWIYERQPDRYTHLPAVAGRYVPVWTPDGRYLILGGQGGLAWMAADGLGTAQPLIKGGNIQIPWSFTPDGTRLAYHELGQTTGFDLWTVPVRLSARGITAGKPELFLQTSAFETYPAFSPDGRWIAYGSNESGSWELYVRAFPDNGKKVQVSTGGGRIARWSSGGRTLFYRNDDQRIMVVDYAIKDSGFTIRSRRQWSQRRLADTGVLANFDLDPDGRRILALLPAVRSEEQQTENHVTLMLNFLSELRRRVSLPGK